MLPVPLAAGGGSEVAVSSTLSTILLLAAGAFATFAVVLLYRVVRGPTTQDRIVAINVVGTNTVIVIALVSVAFGEYGYLDVALVYALLNFVMSIAVSKFTVEWGGVI
ncbi:multicomponent Na+:H+ antiporter subunit F [Haloplanus vescus]|uniref:Multicomponent Na+:H+ antiporter subunit F n=1 Tax=Haloplanus vescus TaxID=555874 RepID=A0A1H3W1R0_9EURY|nr:cation:proton antiporter [Haloplanus vescus]SDZ81067.1 multicomponent Na+:H+ antiporter subunit F [Haloplanus vescus]